jgi:hypothetical protein
MVLIGIAGKMGCGKDYICNNVIIPILKHHNETFLQLAFADQIKINVMTKHNVDFKDVYINKTTETRRLLQLEGTENGRDLIDKNIWINYFHNWVNVFKSRNIKNFICTDVRFKNELDYIKNNGGILILINAPKRNLERLNNESQGNSTLMEYIKNHRSECDLDDLNSNVFDLVINNDPDNNINLVYKEFYELYISKYLNN